MSRPPSTAPSPGPFILSWLRWWWPALGLMTFIFFASTDLGAMSHQSRLLGPFLRWLGVGEAQALEIIGFVRKGGHFGGYALLGLACWRGWWARPLLFCCERWPLHQAAVPLVLAALYACSDEWHQSFVPSRTASVSDVLLDSTGAAVGLAALWVFHRLRAGRAG
ncbi:MAG: VanZ family protein [Verrucomicrobia bacterium]|nr:VanZ family protein [Verrucomicrobiota bacterium]